MLAGKKIESIDDLNSQFELIDVIRGEFGSEHPE
tara:strand:+ start:422 stop:523 length:102 start_codon:yes stop_codon:yes gene_type:complete